jgi:hypothetical protein
VTVADLVWPGRICRFFYELLARRYLLDVLLRDIRQGSGGDVPDSAAEVRDAVGSVIADPEIAESVERDEVAVATDEGEGEGCSGVGVRTPV